MIIIIIYAYLPVSGLKEVNAFAHFATRRTQPLMHTHTHTYKAILPGCDYVGMSTGTSCQASLHPPPPPVAGDDGDDDDDAPPRNQLLPGQSVCIMCNREDQVLIWLSSCRSRCCHTGAYHLCCLRRPVNNEPQKGINGVRCEPPIRKAAGKGVPR